MSQVGQRDKDVNIVLLKYHFDDNMLEHGRPPRSPDLLLTNHSAQALHCLFFSVDQPVVLINISHNSNNRVIETKPDLYVVMR